MIEERGLGEKLEMITAIIELTVYAVLATAILVGVVWVLIQISGFASTLAGGHGEGTVINRLAREELLSILDAILLLVIGLDVLRTILVSIVYRELYLVAAVEAAMLAVVREIIGSEIRHRSVTDLLGYASVIVLLGGLWILAQREFRRVRASSGEQRG